MPVPISQPSPAPLFPALTPAHINAARTSAWLPTFEDISIPATVIDLSQLGDERQAFLEWIDADSIFLPENSEGNGQPSARPRSSSTSSSSSAHSSHSSSSSLSEAPVYRLPLANAAIRAAIAKYGGGVFPKLNWTSPRDAAFLLPQTAHGPLYCTSPADVYLLLKSSDFVSHDLDPESVYATNDHDDAVDSVDDDDTEGHVHGVECSRDDLAVEIVLKKYLEINPAREVRCFVRDKILLGISQRDSNYYEHLQSPDVQRKICDSVRAFWEDEIRENYDGGDHYVFDLYLSEAFLPTIIDFQPYRASTDSLGFTYSELQSILLDHTRPRPVTTGSTADDPSSTLLSNGSNLSNLSNGVESDPRPRLPILRVINSPSHPAASRAAPAFGANMMPIEMLEMSQGHTLEEFRVAWDEAVAAGMHE